MTTRNKVIAATLVTISVAAGLYFAVKAELEPLPGPQTHKQRRRLNRPLAGRRKI